MVLKTTFDSGSNTDAVSEKVAIQLKKLGVPWGEAGGGVSMAVSSSVAVPHGELRLLLSAEPSGSDGRADELAIPRPLQFVTDALIMKDLSNDLIIGWPTLKGAGLLAVLLGCPAWTWTAVCIRATEKRNLSEAWTTFQTRNAGKWCCHG